MQLRVLSTTDVKQALPMQAAIEGMKKAYAQLSAQQVVLPLRSHLETAQGISLVMPAYLPNEGSLAVKIVSVFPDNLSKKLPVINGVVIVLDDETGMPLALMDGGSLTAIRTGAASGAATDVLARQEVSSVGIFGSGVQARTQLEAVCTIREIELVWVYSPNREHAELFAEDMRGKGAIPDTIHVADDPNKVAANAEILCTATSSSAPVFDASALQPGTHINAVGTFMTTHREVDTETIQQSLVVVDNQEAIWEEAGELVIPLQAGEITTGHIHAELGEIINGEKAGRTNEEQITFFKSVGIAVQDAVAGRIALENAVGHNIGQIITL